MKASFEAIIREDLALLGRCIGDAAGDAPTGTAMAALSTMVGAIILSRAVNGADLAQGFLDAAADQIRAVAVAKKSAALRSSEGERRRKSRQKASTRRRVGD